MYGDADEALKKRESVLYLSNHQSTGKTFKPKNQKIYCDYPPPSLSLSCSPG